jgi:cbb3-type cytochrome oxidase subunit 3
MGFVMRKFIKIIAMFILFIVLIFAVLWVFTSADRKIAKEFVILMLWTKDK